MDAGFELSRKDVLAASLVGFVCVVVTAVAVLVDNAVVGLVVDDEERDNEDEDEDEDGMCDSEGDSVLKSFETLSLSVVISLSDCSTINEDNFSSKSGVGSGYSVIEFEDEDNKSIDSEFSGSDDFSTIFGSVGEASGFVISEVGEDTIGSLVTLSS